MHTSNPTTKLAALLDQLATPYILLVLVLVFALAVLYVKSARTRVQSLPAVPGHWLFKNQSLLGAPWRAILLAQKYQPLYGEIIQLSTPFKTVVVLNSAQAVSEVLEKQSAVTSDRPRNVMLFEMCAFGKTVAFRNHDETHRKHRRVMASALHPAAARSYTDLHTATSAFFLRDITSRIISRSNEHHLVVGPNSSALLVAAIRDSIGRFIMRMTYGHVVVEDDPLLSMVKQHAQFLFKGFATHFWVNDLPILRHIPSWLPGARFKRDADSIYGERDRLADEPFAGVMNDVSRGEVQRPSYSSKLLQSKGGVNASKEDIELVKLTALPMFGAGSTTTIALIHNFLFMMCIHPDIAVRVQAEIDAQVGRDRLPTLRDRETMPYMDAVLQEVIRCSPIFPFGLEHCASEDFEVRGYRIKKGTTIEANIWALMHEPATYANPHTFSPDRFLKETPDPDPRRFLFGFGRRVCPGQHVANNGGFTMCAAFMSVFNIKAGEETAREVEECGREVWKMFMPYGPFEPKPFSCTIEPRDQAALALLEMCKETEVIN